MRLIIYFLWHNIPEICQVEVGAGVQKHCAPPRRRRPASKSNTMSSSKRPVPVLITHAWEIDRLDKTGTGRLRSRIPAPVFDTSAHIRNRALLVYIFVW